MTICEKITQRFPVRKTEEQKQAFRHWVRGEMARLGYSARVTEHDKGRQQNIVVGDPPHAELTITAHYDTPSTIWLPDLQIPRNFPVYLLWQMAVIGLMMLVSLAVGIGVGLATKNGNVMLLSFFGPAFLKKTGRRSRSSSLTTWKRGAAAPRPMPATMWRCSIPAS